MTFSIKNVEDLQKLNQSISIESQVKALRLQDRLGEQNFLEDMNKVFEPLTKSKKDVSEEVTKTLIENSINNNKAIQKLNGKILELMNDKRMIARCLASSLVNGFKPETKSPFILIQDLNSTMLNVFLVNGCIPVTIFSNMLTFRDNIKSFKLGGGVLETMTNYDSNDNFSNPTDQKSLEKK